MLRHEDKKLCWRPKSALIDCLIKTKCFEEKQDIEECLATAECFLERKNWVLCRMNSINPRYRLRGNPYDISTEDQKKVEARNERIVQRQIEEEGVDLERVQEPKKKEWVKSTY